MRGKKILNFSIIAISFTVLMLAFVAVAPPVFAAHCTVVTAPASIQAAVDANPGGVICLDDSGGDFVQTVVFDAADSGTTLTADHGDSPVLNGATLAGTGPTTISAIELLGGVTGVTIEKLEIKNYKGDSSGNDRSSGIVAAAGTTSGITITKNNIHDNFWNGILVFSAGDFMHDNWKVEKNHVADNGFVGIELTNTTESRIVRNNVVDNSLHGILVQARNTIGSGVTPIVFDIVVKGNNVSGTVLSDGIRFLAFQGDSSTFLGLAGATAEITEDCKVIKNNVHENASGIRLQSFNVGATVELCVVQNNNVQNNTGSGIRLLASGFTGVGTTDSNDVLRNTASDNGGDGIAVAGTGNEINNNKAMENTADGIDCTGVSNTELRNIAKNNGGTNNTGCP